MLSGRRAHQLRCPVIHVALCGLPNHLGPVLVFELPFRGFSVSDSATFTCKYLNGFFCRAIAVSARAVDFNRSECVPTGSAAEITECVIPPFDFSGRIEYGEHVVHLVLDSDGRMHEG